MSSKPHPVALTSAMFAHLAGERMHRQMSGTTWAPYDLASLASDLHRLAKGCQRLAVAEGNGEWRAGERGQAMRLDQIERPHPTASRVAILDASIGGYADRLDKRIAKLNRGLAPLGVRAERLGDPRGYTLILRSTDPRRPLLSNGMEGGVWGIV